MSASLRDIRNCFEGVIPSIIATVDADGLPNVSYLSHVHFVDDEHVALSNQFFSKTAANVRTTGGATVLVVDARTGDQHMLDLRYVGAVAEGELFQRMAAQLEAASSEQGMGEVMALRSADLYRVVDHWPVPNPQAAGPTPSEPTRPDRLAAAADLAAVIAAEPDADAMLDRALDGLVELFGYANAMALTPDETGRRLLTLASRGYATAGVGSEVEVGRGAIGIAARTGRPVRFSDMSRGRRFNAAVAAELDTSRLIPLPRLGEAQSQLAVPMISRERLFGVLFLESTERFAFSHDDENALVLVAGQVAAGLRLLELEGRGPDAAPAARAAARGTGAPFGVRHYSFDDSVFIDGAYVIKGVPGRLLFHLLSVYVATGRREFTNREIRLEQSLRLPDIKDNLETRLILLRRRLEERGAPVQLRRLGRGLIGLEVVGAPSLETAEGPGRPTASP
ncbi:GAF domain-containing protein [Phenylobacterium sp.]|uniref:GAF domain-containing protein n=1 Tax=Phenylobacterium sp. TaxID=1871053 RepID=UPI0035AE2319